MADAQTDPAEELRWDLRALDAADSLTDDRAKEHLVPADQAVVRVRRVLLDSVRRVMAGKSPVGVNLDLTGVSACDADIDEGADWQALIPSHRAADAMSA